ncbi:hypothetical protein [Rhizobium sp. P44RR-XXIV]|uniref:hypothetical protein n=1 Tax=Rhizobium sp. P44RR-XXIV TaxID=1921145 RepID=UPI000985F97E|nr:hypothetical protein [Rhizobium sp. P44RR-XXIV]TIX89364.1 hypothetical protein BSK43_022535 [Rhizobium sp. P44RR-XXIV]
MSKVNDLIASAKSVWDRYDKGRMERETVREWVLRLGAYPPPHGDRVREAVEWFKAHSEAEVAADIRNVDLDRLRAIFS